MLRTVRGVPAAVGERSEIAPVRMVGGQRGRGGEGRPFEGRLGCRGEVDDGRTEQGSTEMTGRRAALKKIGAAGAVAWTAPVISSTAAGAQGSGFLSFAAVNFGLRQVYRSTDDGLTWVAAATQPPGTNGLYEIGGSAPLFILGETLGTVSRSTDSGQTWVAATTQPGGDNAGGVATNNTNAVLVDLAGAAFVSGDGGDNWAAATTQPATGGSRLSAVVNIGSTFAAVQGAPGSGSFYSLDNGVNWAASTTPVDGAGISMGVSGTTMIAVGSSGGRVWRSVDGGVNWAAATTPPTGVGALQVVAGNSPNWAIGQAGGQGWVSDDDGLTWTTSTTSPTETLFNRMGALGSTFVGGTTSGVLWRSADNGVNWTQVANPGGQFFGVAV